MKNKNTFFLFYIFCLFSGICYSANTENGQVLALKKNWKYRWGDSPFTKSGKLLWCIESGNDSLWNAINVPSDIPLKPGSKNLWVKLRLDNKNINYSALLIDRIEKVFEVYLDTNRIYKYGEFNNRDKIPITGFAWHLIKLPENSYGKTLFFRIRTDIEYIGFYSSVRFGSEEFFITEILKSNLGKIILGIVFIFSGAALLIILLFTGKVKSFLGMIIFMEASGIWTLANSKLTQVFIYAPKLIYYADHLSLFAAAIGFYMLVVEIIIPKYKILFTRFYQFFIAYWVIVLILDLTGISDNMDTVAPFLLIIICSVFVLVYYMIISARKGSGEAKIFLIAVSVYMVFALLDIFNYFQNVFFNPDTYEMLFAHYGGFGFLLVTGWIFVSRYDKMNKQMLLAELNERTRIARDLHDEVGPRLTEIKMVSESVKEFENISDEEVTKLNELSTAADQVVATLSEIVWVLNPTNDTLEEFGCYLSQVAINFLQKADIRCRVDMPPVFSVQKISYEIRRNILMAVKESLNNIVKHADASLVTVQLSVLRAVLTIVITDDGCGFDITNVRKYGNGLKNIEKRIKSIHGSYAIETKIDNGTTVRMEVPLFENQLLSKP